MIALLLAAAYVFQWDALKPDPETTFDPPVAGYRLYYGNAPGDHPWSVDAGNKLTYSMPDYALEGQRWYFICQAYTTAGTKSLASNEVIVDARKPSPTPTPTPTPSPTATPAVKRVLTVYSGTGDGSYAPGAKVTVTADAPPNLFIFSEWQGDVHLLNDATKSPAVLTMPDTNASIMAVYKRKL